MTIEMNQSSQVSNIASNNQQAEHDSWECMFEEVIQTIPNIIPQEQSKTIPQEQPKEETPFSHLPSLKVTVTVNQWTKRPSIVPQESAESILARLRFEEQQRIKEEREAEQRKQREKYQKEQDIKKKAFELLNDPNKFQKILFKTQACKFGANCRNKACSYYHNEQERRVPACPFEHICNNAKCTFVHPGQEEKWLKDHPTVVQKKDQDQPSKKTTHSSVPTKKYTSRVLRIESSLLQSNKQAVEEAIKLAQAEGKQIVFV